MSKQELIEFMKTTGNQAKDEEFRQCKFMTNDREHMIAIIKQIDDRILLKQKKIKEVTLH